AFPPSGGTIPSPRYPFRTLPGTAHLDGPSSRQPVILIIRLSNRRRWRPHVGSIGPQFAKGPGYPLRNPRFASTSWPSARAGNRSYEGTEQEGEGAIKYRS